MRPILFLWKIYTPTCKKNNKQNEKNNIRCGGKKIQLMVVIHTRIQIHSHVAYSHTYTLIDAVLWKITKLAVAHVIRYY